MRAINFALLSLSALATRAMAGDVSQSAASSILERPGLAMPAAWVLPAPVPTVPPKANGEDTIELLTDIQRRFLDAGDATYVNDVYQIASAKGLDDGPLKLAWNPDFETLTLHRYRILRDGKAIDLLGDGSKLTVIRRETNLDNATLDGELTVTMQPEDLRVGDTIDLAYTRTRHDPAMGGKSEAIAGPQDGATYGRYRLRMIWPASKALRWRADPGIIQPQLSHSAAGNELLADLVNITAPLPPAGAPSRFQLINSVEISEFADWGAVARAFAPLYDTAAKLAPQSPIRALAGQIAAATSDPKQRAERALKLVQEQIRYLFVGMDDGGFVPAAADVTWSRRYGDCKGKTVLLTALLRELGIDARAVLVNTEQGDFVAARLPAMGAFDHAIVEARIAGRSYWLDGTRLGDTNLDFIDTPNWHVGLPVVANSAGLVPLVPAPPGRPTQTISLSLDATDGIDVPASARAEMRFRGQSATDMRVKYSGLNAADLDTALRKLWRETYDFITPAKLEVHDEPASGDFVLTLVGMAKMDWSPQSGVRWYELDRARVGWKWAITRESDVNRDAPYAFDYPDYWENRETIKLPNAGAGFKLQGGSLDQTVGGLYAFHRKVAIEDGSLVMENSTRALKDELPAETAQAVHDAMAELGNTGVFIRLPNDYMRTDKEIAALGSDKAASAQAYLARGAQRVDLRDYKGGLADENAALALDQNLAPAHAVRALALAGVHDAGADAAADRAITLDPKQWLAWNAKAEVAYEAKRFLDAERDFTSLIAINPQYAHAFAGRGVARLALQRPAEALADFDTSLGLLPAQPLVRGTRAAALFALGRIDEALSDADQAIAAQADAPKMREMRAVLRFEAGHHDLAREDFDWLIAHEPTSAHYLKRAMTWPTGNTAHRAADVDAVLTRARMAMDAGDYAGAQSYLAKAEAIKPDATILSSMRMTLLQKQGRAIEAMAVADSSVAKHPGNAMVLNERCWFKATTKLQFETALADCDAALKIAPNSPAILDSRAFVLLQLGRNDEAIAQYTQALSKAPMMAASLFGRAIARARLGDRTDAQVDLAAARNISPEIDQRFEAYGVRLPAAGN